MLKEMLRVIARYEDEAEVFGGDLDHELIEAVPVAAANQVFFIIRELYDLKLITCSKEQEDNGLVTVHSARAVWILEALG